MKVEKIKKLKSGKYKIELDNHEKILTYDDVILNNHLLFNKNISNELFNKLNIETEYYDVYNKCIKYITTKMRSKLEMEKYLDKLGIDKGDKTKIINNLMTIGLINDSRFVKAFISDKINLSNIGPNKIRQELTNHNIDSNLIEEVLSNYDDDVFNDKIIKLVEKKKKNTKYSNYILKQKLLVELSNLGYDKDMILSILNDVDLNDNDSLFKEFDKVYYKLSKKYSGYDLINNVKSKLYQKGYKMEEINNCIQKRIVD